MKQYLVDLIKINGPISVSSFMNEILFNPKFGYYINQTPFGKKGDFITAPEISQVFGELIGVYLVHLWQNNYNSGEIVLVEMGAGNGTLMRDLLNFATKIPNFLNKAEINIIEVSPKLQKIQQENLKNFNIKWYSNFADFTASRKDRPLFFVANELLDCFAINQYVQINHFWQERLIGLSEDNNLQFVLAPKNQKLNEIIKSLAGDYSFEGAIFEHSPALENFISELFSYLKANKGIALLIDYGYEKNKFESTLQALKNHQYSNIFESLGESDLTALVNFKRLRDLAKTQQIQSWLVTQKEFLESLGIEIRRQKLIEGKILKEQELINSSINRLIAKDQMGDLFRVFICSA